jgi:hypothetical protein
MRDCLVESNDEQSNSQRKTNYDPRKKYVYRDG